MQFFQFTRSGKVRTVALGPLYVAWGLYPGGWFTLFGYGLSLSDHRHEPPLFMERYNTTWTFWHFGPWCLTPLTPHR